MKSSNITKLDSKGRILIPMHIRKYLKVEEGTELIVIPDEKSQARILPLLKDKTAELKFLLADVPGNLASVANILADNNINILMSEGRTLAKGKLAELRVIVDISQYKKGFKKLTDQFSNSKNIKSVEIVRK